ncbi:MAG: hypothetical protein PHN75_02750 [Syntrophales bacterium]|nr:hypothetical protein [Syntrophales bacterium]
MLSLSKHTMISLCYIRSSQFDKLTVTWLRNVGDMFRKPGGIGTSGTCSGSPEGSERVPGIRKVVNNDVRGQARGCGLGARKSAIARPQS